MIIGASLLTPFFVFAQSSIPEVCNDNVSGKSEAELQSDLASCNAEIAKWQQVLNSTRGRVTTIDGDVKQLTAKINAASATIKAKNIAISKLSSDIDLRSEKIQGLEELVEEGRDSIGDLMRNIRVYDDYTMAEVMFSSESLSDFFVDFESYNSIQSAIEGHLTDLRSHISLTEEEKEKLNDIQKQELDAKYEVEIKKQSISAAEQEKKAVLEATKLEAKSYEQIVADRRAKASQINAALFRLRGVDGGGIPFKDALNFANIANKVTGVRSAFILGILRQESNLGVNVGQCLLVDTVTGDGKGKNTGTPFSGLMKPDRDIPYFMDLMSRLGRDPFNTPLSCPQPGGYGGAMGPTQFIPSTWRGYEGRISQAFGGVVGDPWNPEHAIMATALFLQDLGAGGGGYSAEREAAARYYAGGGWAERGLGYADSVLGHSQTYQTNIDFLTEN